MAKNVFHHRPGYQWLVTAVRSTQQQRLSWRLGGQSERCKSVHDEVYPEHLDGLQRGVLQEESSEFNVQEHNRHVYILFFFYSFLLFLPPNVLSATDLALSAKFNNLHLCTDFICNCTTSKIHFTGSKGRTANMAEARATFSELQNSSETYGWCHRSILSVVNATYVCYLSLYDHLKDSLQCQISIPLIKLVLLTLALIPGCSCDNISCQFFMWDDHCGGKSSERWTNKHFDWFIQSKNTMRLRRQYWGVS